MDEQEEDQEGREEEMEGTGGLLASEDGDEGGEDGGDGRGHGESGPDDEGEESEDDSEVGEALKGVVSAVVTAEEEGGDVNEAGEDADPGGKKMHGAPPAGLAGDYEGKREVEERGRAEAAGFAPIETRVGQENRDAADEERERGECRDPVSQPDDYRMFRRHGLY